MRRPLRWGCGISAISAQLLVTAWLSNTLFNDWRRARIEAELGALHSPYDRSVLKRASRVGNTHGTGDQLHLFAAELRTYTGSPEQLRRWYRGRTVRIWPHRAAVNVEVVPPGWHPGDMVTLVNSLERPGVSPPPDAPRLLVRASAGSHYVVYVRARVPMGLDIRGL